MTAIDPRKFLWDAGAALGRIARFTAGRTFRDYETDEMLRSAVERQYEIVGEALASLRRAAPEIAERIPEIHRIIAFRNIPIHQYAAVDDRLVWDVVEGGTVGLREVTELLLRELDRP